VIRRKKKSPSKQLQRTVTRQRAAAELRRYTSQASVAVSGGAPAQPTGIAQVSPVRVVEKEEQIRACKFVGQIMKSNGLLQTKTADRLLQQALQDAAKLKADTAVVRKSAHSGVTIDVYMCSAA